MFLLVDIISRLPLGLIFLGNKKKRKEIRNNHLVYRCSSLTPKVAMTSSKAKQEILKIVQGLWISLAREGGGPARRKAEC